ncbi:MAG: hypothetical protein JWP49_2436 [Phenylobacterium sp.]|jgi:hypothetical protein|nr:hypothetical protein [Phenylobacterium sp.]
MASFDLSGLPPAERAAAYRALADMHLQLGQDAAAEAGAAHLELAALWTRLAAQAEHQAAVAAAHTAAPSDERPSKASA